MEHIFPRIQTLETSFTDMASRIDAYVQRMTAMMNTVEEHDKTVKGTIETMQNAIRKEVMDSATIAIAQVEAIKQEVGQRITTTGSRVQATDVQVTRSETDSIAMQQQINSMEQEVF